VKKVFVIALLGLFVSNAHADWRMERFDINQDGFVIKEELKEAGCKVKVGLFNAADKNDDGKLSKGELRKASEYIIRHRCPKN
jgi:Ca2+-binding EF-hand superfamily protein